MCIKNSYINFQNTIHLEMKLQQTFYSNFDKTEEWMDLNIKVHQNIIWKDL